MRFLKHLSRLTLVIAALAVVLPATASAAPCWNKLLNDWYDGRIDKTYKVECYKQALRHLPTDIQVYSSARDDIQRALASAVAQAAKDHVKNVGQLDVTPTPTTSDTPAQTQTVDTTPADTTSTEESKGAAPPGRDNNDDGPFGVALAKAGDSPDSVPLPLIVLGVLALLLVAGGGAGLLVRRMQTRGDPAA